VLNFLHKLKNTEEKKMATAYKNQFVTVYKPYTMFSGGVEPATVGWASVLPVDPETARQFAYDLLKAADAADALNKEAGV
jgi:hypothetical protein